MSLRRRAIAMGTACGVLLVAAGASAAPCGRPDVDATFPPQGSMSVPSNASLFAHYASPALYDDEPVALRDPNGAEVPLRVSFDEALSLLKATPERTLEEGPHHLEWPGLRGVGSGGVGRGAGVDFSVSAGADESPPQFEGLSGVDWDLSRERDPCLDKLEDRFVFRLQAGPADDDAGVELLTLLVFQTRDPTAPERTEPIQVALQPFPRGAAVEVRRPATESGATCFAAVARDLLGGVSGGGDREVCVTTASPPFFEGCSVSPRGRSPYAVLVCIALLLLRRGKGASVRAA